MPRFRVRVEACKADHDALEAVIAEHAPPNTKASPKRHFREYRLVADDADAARAAVERMELKKALYEIPAADFAAHNDPDNDFQVRLGMRTTHEQSKPFEVKTVEELS